MEGLHYGVTPEKRPRRLPRGYFLEPRLTQCEPPRGSRVWDPRKQGRPEGWAGAQPCRNRQRDPWRTRSKLAMERVLLSKLPLESLKNTHGNMTH